MLEPGQVLGNYVVEQLIAESTDNSIYGLRHERFGAAHALKIQREAEGIREPLLHEGRIQGTIRHPNVLRITDFVEVEGRFGLVMDRMKGTTLEDWIRDHDMPIPTAVVLFSGIAQGLFVAHRHDIVHRLLCPAKILVDPESVSPRIIDFGMSKEMEPTLDEDTSISFMFPFVGVPAYTAPEQSLYAAGALIESDMFSLGCILYELLCGVAAFPTDSAVEARRLTLIGSYEPVGSHGKDIPRDLEVIISRLLQTEPEDRIGDCGSLLRMLNATDTLS